MEPTSFKMLAAWKAITVSFVKLTKISLKNCLRQNCGGMNNQDFLQVLGHWVSLAIKLVLEQNLMFALEFTDENEVKSWKQYFISSPDLMLTAFDAALLCRSFDLQLLSPRNQNELDLIMSQLSENVQSVNYNDVLIGVYLAEASEKFWLSGDQEYEISLSKDSAGSEENCLGFNKENETNKIQLRTISCEKKSQFMCEENFSEPIERTTEGSERFLKRLAEYQFESSQESVSKLLYVSHHFLQTSWIKAQQICSAFGMDLFVPETSLESKIIFHEFQANPDLPKSFHVGAMNINRGYVSTEHIYNGQGWYSIATNNFLNLKTNRKDEDDSYQNCGKMEVKKGHYHNMKKISCTEDISNFICQKNLIKNETQFRFVEKPDLNDEDYGIPYQFNWIHDESKLKFDIFKSFYQTLQYFQMFLW